MATVAKVDRAVTSWERLAACIWIILTVLKVVLYPRYVNRFRPPQDQLHVAIGEDVELNVFRVKIRYFVMRMDGVYGFFVLISVYSFRRGRRTNLGQQWLPVSIKDYYEQRKIFLQFSTEKNLITTFDRRWRRKKLQHSSVSIMCEFRCM